MSGDTSKMQPWKTAVADQDSSITKDAGTTEPPMPTKCVPGEYAGKNETEETLYDTGKGSGTDGKDAGTTEPPLPTKCVPGEYAGKNETEETLYDTGVGTGTGDNGGSSSVGVGESTK